MNTRISPARICAVVVLTLGLSTPANGEDLLENSDFQDWTGDRPNGWSVDVGARNPGTESSQLAPLEGGGIVLSGSRDTGTWLYVTQKVATTPNTYLRIRFTARARGLKRDAGQYNNCYVGLTTWDAAGQRLSIQARDVFEEDWAAGQLIIRVPDKAVSVDAAVFLSKTGRLEVRSVELESLSATDSFDVLVDELARYYSFFALKDVAWRERSAEFRDAAQALEAPEEFAEAVRPLLSSLDDLHIWMTLPDGTVVGTSSSQGDPNIDVQQTVAQLKDVRQIGKIALVGRTEDGFGYVLIGSLQGPQDAFDELQTAILGLFDAPGLIIDLRVNGGGDERRAQRIAALFNDSRRIYARQQVRSGPAYDDLAIVGERYLSAADHPFEGRVVGLIGPRCISSGEGFAAMLAAIPGIRLVGKPTQGASGNPAGMTLPNGLSVHYSTWISLLPDGSVLEGRGVQPDVDVDQTDTGDATLDAAIELLHERQNRD